MVTVDNLKEYMHLPPDNDEDLTQYLQAARSKARAAGVPDYKDNALYDEFLLEYASAKYDSRGLASTADTDKMQRMIDSYVLELRYAGEDEEETGE